MEQQWEKGEALQRINGGRWDYVVLQAQSSEIIRMPDSFAEYAKRFNDAIIARHAKTVIVETRGASPIMIALPACDTSSHPSL